MTDADREELETLRRYDYLCSLGDRPQSPAATKLLRLMELEDKERAERIEAALLNAFCDGMDGTEPADDVKCCGCTACEPQKDHPFALCDGTGRIRREQ